MDFSTSPSKVFIVIERLPKGEKRFSARFSSSIKKDADFRVQYAPKSIEQPSVRIYLFAIFLFQAENHLYWRQGSWGVILRLDKLLVGRDRELRCIFKLGLCQLCERSGIRSMLTYNVCDCFLSIYILFHDSVLIDTDCC